MIPEDTQIPEDFNDNNQIHFTNVKKINKNEYRRFNNDDKPKYFHELPDEEKQKLKQEIEDQDKNIEEKLQSPKESYENYDWDALKKKLPVEKIKEDRKRAIKCCFRLQ